MGMCQSLSEMAGVMPQCGGALLAAFCGGVTPCPRWTWCAVLCAPNGVMLSHTERWHVPAAGPLVALWLPVGGTPVWCGCGLIKRQYRHLIDETCAVLATVFGGCQCAVEYAMSMLVGVQTRTRACMRSYVSCGGGLSWGTWGMGLYKPVYKPYTGLR